MAAKAQRCHGGGWNAGIRPPCFVRRPRSHTPCYKVRHTTDRPHRVLELGPDPDSCVWLPGARLNIAECALTGELELRGYSDATVAGGRTPRLADLAVSFVAFLFVPGRDPDSAAVVWADESDPATLHSWTYAQLADRSAHIAEGLRAMGMQPGGAGVRLLLDCCCWIACIVMVPCWSCVC